MQKLNFAFMGDGDITQLFIETPVFLDEPKTPMQVPPAISKTNNAPDERYMPERARRHV